MYDCSTVGDRVFVYLYLLDEEASSLSREEECGTSNSEGGKDSHEITTGGKMPGVNVRSV